LRCLTNGAQFFFAGILSCKVAWFHLRGQDPLQSPIWPLDRNSIIRATTLGVPSEWLITKAIGVPSEWLITKAIGVPSEWLITKAIGV